MRRRVLLIVGASLTVTVVLAGLAFLAVAFGQAQEAAMTSCSGVPEDVRKGSSTATVETRFLAWKFTCVFWDNSGHVVARAEAPYDPPWHNLLP